MKHILHLRIIIPLNKERNDAYIVINSSFSIRYKKKIELSLIISGRQLLGIPESEPVSAVLEEDGTEISDEDYFAFIRHNTTIMMLRTGQKWMPVGAGNQMIW